MEIRVDNSKLNELMNIHLYDMNNQQKQEFIEELKNVRLLMPIEITSDLDFDKFHDLKVGDDINFEEGFRYKPIRLKNDEGKVALPLFTDDDHLRNSNILAHQMVMYTEEIAEILKDLFDEFDAIVINVGSEYSISMPIFFFIGLFEEENKVCDVNNNEPNEQMSKYDLMIKNVIEALKNDYIEMPSPTMLFYREEYPYLFEQSVDGVFTTKLPLNMHFKRTFNDELKILNILCIPQGTKVLFLGESVNPETNNPFILAPSNHFKFVKKRDENTYVWEWIGEDFY